MKIRLFTLLIVVYLSDYVYADEVSEIKKGDFPYMAYIYYSDEAVLDITGNRFLRSAVLIRPDWLVTSAIQIGSNDEEARFPRKTLLARVGATSIDFKFTLSEDEHEQEREIIRTVQPSNHSATQWWQADITLMKTLLQFNITSVVSPASLYSEDDNVTKSCTILFYSKKHDNLPENKILMLLPVELLSPSIETCGNHFYDSTMTCASDRDENGNAVYDPNFCQGNNGGPLICEGKIMGLQTYIDNNCKPPHLYQLLAVWNKFIVCSTEDKCAETQCANTCVVTNKDLETTSPQWSTYWKEGTTNVTNSLVDLVEYSPTLTLITTDKEIVTAKEIDVKPKDEYLTFTIKEENITTEEKVYVIIDATTSKLTTPQQPTRTVLLISDKMTLMPDDTTETHIKKTLYRKKAIGNEEVVDEENPENNSAEALMEGAEANNKKQRPMLSKAQNGARRHTSVIHFFFLYCIALSSLVQV